MDNLYTILLDYAGGTYVSQVPAQDVISVLPIWLDKLVDDDLRQWNLGRMELKTATETAPILLDGLQNVWCVSSAGKFGLVLINIVATQTEN